MKLLRLHIENFGTLASLDLDFSDGLNVLHQKNGWGKSTLAVFIKAMFYGLPTTSRRSLDENERKKYTPWQGGAFGGSLEFETARGKFRIERFFAAKEANDSFALFDLTTNKPSAAYSANLGEELFGIDADGFERSTYLSQRMLADGKDNSSISAKLTNLLDDVGDIGSYDDAMAALDKRRRYYVMTGNRGAIADLERERVEKQGELERCLRVREAMQAQESRRAEIADEIASLRTQIAKTHTELQRSALARELAALLEQKNRMLDELSALTEQKQAIEASFEGGIPSVEELSDARRLYEQIRTDSVRLETLGSAVENATALARLRERYPAGLPDEDTLARAQEQTEALHRTDRRREALIGARDGDVATQRFPMGAPSPDALEEASQSLQKAEKLQKTLDTLSQTPAPSTPPFFAIAVALLALGALCAILAWVPALSALRLPLLAIGAGLLLVAVLLFFLGSAARKKQAQRALQLEQKQREWQSRMEHEQNRVRELLTAYRMPIRGNDLSRALTELSLLSAQYREGMEKRRRIAEELEQLSQRRTEVLSALRRFLEAYRITVDEKTDLDAALQSLRQAALRMADLQAAERQRASEMDELRAKVTASKDRLLPFLHRFDPDERLRAGACLDRIAEQRAEHARILHRLEQQQSALTDFIREKKLDTVADLPDPSAYERLRNEESDLQARLETLQKQVTVLGSEIDRLALDADRVPELTEEQRSLGERIDEARKNADTVATTMKLLDEAKAALSTRYLNGMQESFHRFFTALTGEDAPESLMDTSFEIRLREGGQTRTMESFSRGWRDAVRFCVRLSLADALFADGEMPFLLLDDPFVNLDEDRLAAAKALLDRLASQYQILYFVCNRDRI